MNQQQTTHHATSKPQTELRPVLTAGYVGSADIPTDRTEPKPAHNLNYHPPLPGLERYCPQGRPYELDNSSVTLTDSIVHSPSSPTRRDLSYLTYEQRQTVLDWEEEIGLGVGACLNLYPSGEITAGCYSRGNKRPPGQTGRSGRVVSKEFTPQARKKIRRVVDCKITDFKLFLTLTFDPKIAQLNESGVVDQAWAKDRFTQFLNTIKKRYDRLAAKTENDSLRITYIWVAEVQGNGNIHFHILLDRPFIEIKWLIDIWGQSANSVNIKRLNDQRHAANYMLKYMKKGNCPIEGKRYGMTQNLIEGSKPRRFDFYGRAKRSAFLRVKEDLTRQIKENGGYVADWGMSIPSPRRPKQWRDKLGNFHISKGVSHLIGHDFLQRIAEAMAEPGAQQIFDRVEASFVELPF